MSDRVDDRRLDGNAIAGVLGEVFSAEMTTAIGTCEHCGSSAALGTALVYPGGPGTVVRCRACEGVLMRIARIGGTLAVEVRGVRRLELQAGQAARR